ncbi:MAG: helix-turn-helix domain-containing protein [Verrucomicrobiota bacterium]|nr:helix-turn-helix domain-containing protein [Chthoniobacterales bacterium]MDQ3413363.1 helix-turn-helix domain-containing protein [Verrucomicrobiota bacterium]
MQPFGKKLQEARLKKNISVEEASRVTKIRASRIQELEAEDFSSFSSLAYAKGFLLIYGKYLDVDVTPYLGAFENSGEVSVDGYSYLQDAPTTAPPPIVRRQPAKRPAFLPFIIAVAVLVFGWYLIKLLLDIQRITPTKPPPGAVVSATASPSATQGGRIIAPRALPVEGSPASEARGTIAPTASPPPSTPAATEPEVRRAEPVHPEDMVSPEVTTPPAHRVQITPMRKTFLRVTIAGQDEPAFNGWLDPADPPVSFRGSHVTIKVLERGAVQITKNGAALAAGDPDVTFE